MKWAALVWLIFMVTLVAKQPRHPVHPPHPVHPGEPIGPDDNVQNEGDFNSNGPIDIQGELDNSGTITSSGPITIQSGGTLVTGGTITAPVLTNGGDLVSNGVTINGALHDLPQSTTTIATSPGTIHVNGPAMLGGTLVLDTVPVKGAVVTPLVATGGISGQFAQIAPSVTGTNLIQANLYGVDGLKVVFLGPDHGQVVTLASNLPVESQAFLVSALAPNAGAAAIPTIIGFSQGQLIAAILTSSLDAGQLGAWANAFGNFVNVDEGEPQGASYTSVGIGAAVTKAIGKHWLAGAGTGWIRTFNSNLSENTGWGAIYGGYVTDGFYCYAGTIGAGSTFSSQRDALLGVARSNSSAFLWSSFAQTGYNFKVGAVSFGPSASCQCGVSSVRGYSEKGSAAPLRVRSNTQDSIVSELGLKSSVTVGRWSFEAVPRWKHEYAKSAIPSEVEIIGLPTSSTTVFGPPLGHDSLSLSSTLSFSLSDRTMISVSYQGELLRKNYNANAVVATVSLAF